jgi:hypothetical protein
LRRTPLRLLAVSILLLLLITTVAALYVGSRQHRVPAPFGPAYNGQILYTANGDLYVPDALDSSGRLLVGGEDPQIAPAWSPDGQWFTYATTTSIGDRFMVARADGSGSRQVALIPPRNATGAWRPDSGAMALVYDDAERFPIARNRSGDRSRLQAPTYR